MVNFYAMMHAYTEHTHRRAREKKQHFFFAFFFTQRKNYIFYFLEGTYIFTWNPNHDQHLDTVQFSPNQDLNECVIINRFLATSSIEPSPFWSSAKPATTQPLEDLCYAINYWLLLLKKKRLKNNFLLIFLSNTEWEILILLKGVCYQFLGLGRHYQLIILVVG